MLISVNICLYNSLPHIQQTIDSVLRQTYTNLEVIAIDDGSSDGTYAAIRERYASEPRLKLYQQDNHGLGYTRNRCMAMSSGEYIAFLDHDDVWTEQKLELQLEAIDTLPDLPYVVFGDHQVIDAQGELLYNEGETKRNGWVFTEDLFETLLINGKNPIGLSSAMILRKAYDEGVSFPDLKVAEEFALWLRLAHDHPNYAYVPQTLYYYRIHSNNATMRFEEESYTESIDTVKEWLKTDDIRHVKLVQNYLTQAELRYGHWLLAQRRFHEGRMQMLNALRTNRTSSATWWGVLKAFLTSLRTGFLGV